MAAYLARDNTIVIAAVRSVASADSLKTLPKGQGSRLIIVPLDSSNEQAPAKAVQLLSTQGIDHIDVVIANAGIAEICEIEREKVSKTKDHPLANNPPWLLFFPSHRAVKSMR